MDIYRSNTSLSVGGFSKYLFKFYIFLCAFSAISCISSTAVAETIYFSDDFETGTLSKWTSAVPKASVQTNIKFSGNHALHIPYDIAEGGSAHKDNNRFAEVNLSAQDIHHYFVSGCFHLATTAQSPYAFSPVSARKLFYIFSANHGSAGKWDLMVSANGGKDGVPLSISLGSNYYPSYSDLSYPKWDIAKDKIAYDSWHCIEVEMKLNDVSMKNGHVRLWLDGKLEYERTAISIRDAAFPLGIVRVGAQIDRSGDTLERHEDRYWDNIIVSDYYASSSRPSPPSGLYIE